MKPHVNQPIDRLLQETHHRIDALRNTPLKQLDYCQRWVEMSPDDRGYRKACVEAIAEATGLSPRTVNNWGKEFEKCPDYALHALRMADMLNQIRKIVTPPDYPQK